MTTHGLYHAIERLEAEVANLRRAIEEACKSTDTAQSGAPDGQPYRGWARTWLDEEGNLLGRSVDVRGFEDG